MPKLMLHGLTTVGYPSWPYGASAAVSPNPVVQMQNQMQAAAFNNAATWGKRKNTRNLTGGKTTARAIARSAIVAGHYQRRPGRGPRGFAPLMPRRFAMNRRRTGWSRRRWQGFRRSDGGQWATNPTPYSAYPSIPSEFSADAPTEEELPPPGMSGEMKIALGILGVVIIGGAAFFAGGAARRGSRR